MTAVVIEVIAAALAYGGATYATWAHFARGRGLRAVRLAAAAGLIIQPLALVHMGLQAGHMVIGVGTALSLFAWQVALLLWVFSTFGAERSLDALGLAVYPIAALCAITGLMVPDTHSAVEALSWPIQAHIVLSMLAYGLLTLGVVQAVVLSVQHQQLRRRPPSGAMRTLPSLETMETLLFRLIGSGFALLTLAIATGALFISHLFEQHLAHKVFLSLLAWLVFAGLLLGRWCYGWRGRVAVTGAISGYMILVLAYFGSKLVLEVILGIHWW